MIITLTKADQLEATQDFLRFLGMQVPLPTQFLRSLIVSSNADTGTPGQMHTITRATINDFSYSHDSEEKYLDELPLWLWNVKIGPDLTLRLPIWRGETPFDGEPENDEAVLEIVKWCFAEGGLDIQRMTQWIAAFMRRGIT